MAVAAETTNADKSEIESLRQEIRDLRQSYEARLSALETRLESALEPSKNVPAAASTEALSRSVMPASAEARPSAASTSGFGNTSAFNPAVGVIFQGQAWRSHLDEDERSIPGFPFGGEAGPISDGLAIGETEININANVDDLFTAWLTLPVVIEGGETEVEIEEAWIESLGLPAGLSARFGRFFSGIGYLNGKHSHAWDFIDQPLAYQVFMGDQYLDDGIQLRWLAPTDLYTEIGAEVLRGERYPASGAANGGVGARSLFAKIGGDLGTGHSWQAGLSWLHAESRERPSGSDDDPLLFSGDTDLIIAEMVWKWAPQGNWRQRNLVVQSEFIWRNDEGNYLLGADNHAIDADQNGWYAQIVYQPRPQWRVGVRYDQLHSEDPGAAFIDTALDPAKTDPRRYSVMIDWSHSEFSRLRLQYAHDLSAERSNDQWGLQYIFSIGAHGAHSF